MSARDARDAARREFGGVTQTKEIYRERRGLPWIEVAARDLRYAARGLRRNKAFTAVAVLSLALGIGANTAIFTLFHALLLRMLPVVRPQELVMLNRTGAWGRGCAYPFYLETRKRTDLFQGVVARSDIDRVRFSRGGNSVDRARREYVSGNYFDVLGVGAAAGRVIGEQDNRTPHAHPVAVLSYNFWRARFGGDPGAVGQTVLVNEEPLTIVGVAARGFRGVEVDHEADLWEPAMMRPGEIMQPGANWAWIVARRRPEVSRSNVQAAVDVLLRRVPDGRLRLASERRVPADRDGAADRGSRCGRGLSELREQFGAPLQVLMAAVGLALLAACANVANLLLARAAARRKEIVMRISLGATRGRLLAQSLMEGLLLGAFGAALGMAMAFEGAPAILRFLPAGAGDALATTPDGAVLAFTAAISIVVVLILGLVPALGSTLRLNERETAGPARLRRVLVTAQVAFSVVLVAMALLFSHSLAELHGVNLGFRNQSAIAFTLDFPRSWKPEQTKAARERFTAHIETLPGVGIVTGGFPGPFSGGYSSATVRVPGSEETVREAAWVNVQNIAPRYFEALGGAVAAGREFDRNDTAQSRSVAVVNEAFVRRFLPGEPRVLEHVLEMGPAPTFIVGVVRDIANDDVRKPPPPTVYVPAAQSTSPWQPTIVVSTSGRPEPLIAAIRGELAEISAASGDLGAAHRAAAH